MRAVTSQDYSLRTYIHKTNMLHIIGLGLADERDISVKGLEIVKKAERVYLEAYTAVLLVDQSVLVRKRPMTTAYLLVSRMP